MCKHETPDNGLPIRMVSGLRLPYLSDQGLGLFAMRIRPMCGAPG